MRVIGLLPKGRACPTSAKPKHTHTHTLIHARHGPWLADVE